MIGSIAYLRELMNVAIIMGAGDMVAQLAFEKKSLQDWNVGRTARFSGLGLVFVGPVLRKWYGTLDTLLTKKQPAVRRGIKKMLIDQACFAPPFTLLLSYLVPFVNGEKHDKIVGRIKEDFLNIMMRGYMIWPLVQIINFAFMPLHHQMLFVQIVAFLWNGYLSMKLNQ